MNRSSSQPVVAVYDGNAGVINFFRRTLSSRYHLSLHSDAGSFLQELRSVVPALLVFAWDGPEASLELLREVRALKPTTPLVVLTCSTEPADFQIFAEMKVASMVLKPFVDGELETALASSILPVEIPKETVKEVPLDGSRSFIRSSKQMRDIETQATLVARSNIPVLILGESGTGKEILALFTHKMSRRSDRMFLKVNCAAMPAELLESELFGYEQGAFTGAIKTKPGKFEVCDGGTIFLDEIGEMPAILQAKLLQVLQDGTFSRLGSRSPMRTDVRVIAATNINLKKAMAEKLFREDLYYRLNGISLLLPPLRERLEEIPAFIDYFMRKAVKLHQLQPLPVSPELLQALCRHTWRGNLRELENVINRYLILQDEQAILTELAHGSGTLDVIDAVAHESAANAPASDLGLKHIVRGLKGEAESIAIAKALQETGWNRKAAASELQISYKALLYKIKQYELKKSA